MTWLTLRQLRASAAGLYAVVVAAVVVLAVTGPALARLHHQSPADFFDRLSGTDHFLYYAAVAAVVVTPALIGVFWGAPMIARELETGTHRLVWTQSVSRTRWLAVQLGVTALAALAATALLSLAVTWWSGPLDGARGTNRGNLPSRLTPVVFDGRGVAPLGYALFALVLGATLGAVFRRTLPAMAVTLLLVVGVQIAVPLWIRPHLVPTATLVVEINRDTLDEITIDGPGQPVRIGVHTPDHGTWVLSNETIDSAGNVARPAWLDSCLPRPPGDGGPGAVQTPATQKNTMDTCFSRMTAEGYRQRRFAETGGSDLNRQGRHQVRRRNPGSRQGS